MLGTRVKQLLKDYGITRVALSEHLGITTMGLDKKILNQRQFSIKEIILIKELLNVSYDELLHRED